MEMLHKLPKDILVKILTEQMSIETQIDKLAEENKLDELTEIFCKLKDKIEALLINETSCFKIENNLYHLSIVKNCQFNDRRIHFHWSQNGLIQFCGIYLKGRIIETFHPSESINEICRLIDKKMKAISLCNCL